MPCDTKVLIDLKNDKWTLKAREKLGLGPTERVDEATARSITLEAGKLKTTAVIKAMYPTAIIKGTGLGLKKLTIQVNI